MSDTPADTPMFPLGSVLLPTMVLPLHVFEPRYRAMMRRCVDGGEQFGVTLIERGHEVGGGDVRSDVGCMAQVLAHDELPDGRWRVVTVGTSRIRVDRWLTDDPYPRALTTPWPDPSSDGQAVELMVMAEIVVRDLLELARVKGLATATPDIEMSDEPVEFSYQASAVMPLGPFDRYRLLTADGASQRLGLLMDMAVDARVVLEEGGGEVR